MLPATMARVAEHTPEHVNARIRKRTAENIEHFAKQGREAITHRLEELDREWDIERALETNAAAMTVAGALLALTVRRTWAVVPLAVGGFLLQHALQGWCPPVSIFRRLGLRTAAEIDEERYTLRAIRGDFAGTVHAGSSLPGEHSIPAQPEPMANAAYSDSPAAFRPTH